MRVHGMGIGFVDVKPEHALEYNRWWDLTMGPENAALSELAGARRYVATPEYQALRGPVEEPTFEPGRAAYCHVYSYATENVAAGMGAMAALAARLGTEGRGFGKGRSSYEGPQRLVNAWSRSDLGIEPVAIPYIGHVAIQVSIGRITEKARTAEIEAWYDQVHIPDILETPGFLAAVHLVPVDPDPERDGRFMNLFYLDAHPARALAALRERMPGLRDRGRLEAPGKAVRLLFGGPFRPLIPLEYDFL